MARHRRKCAYCPAMYETEHPGRQRFCSRRRAQMSRPVEVRRAHAAKGAAARKTAGYSARERRFRAAGLTEAQKALVRKELHQVQTNAYESGRRKGWAEALGERDSRAA